MRVLAVARRRIASHLSPRACVNETSMEPSEFSSTACLQLQQERAFSAPMVRSRTTSPWTVQRERQTTAQLASTTPSLAAAAAWQASVSNTESYQVEDWLAALHQVDTEARGLCSDLLTRHPMLLWKDAQRTTGVVQVLLDATRQRHLLRPYYMQDANILALVDRYTPESLRARLSELHRLVWQRLDDDNLPALFASRTSLDLLDLDAQALALKAQALRALVPEFPPSAVLRSCPELLDVQVDDMPGYVRRAGEVVVVGANVAAEYLGGSNVVIVRSRVASSGGVAASAAAAVAAAASAGRVLRTARCGVLQLLLQERIHDAESAKAVREVVRVFCNSRQLVFAAGDKVEVRVEDPHKAQETLSAACRAAVLQQRLSAVSGGRATAGVRYA